MKNRKINNLENFALILFGVCWIFTGIKTLFKPVYYFRGAYVDFTGWNIQVGVALIVVGILFISGYFWKLRK